MKKRTNTPQPDEAAEASSSGTANHPVDAARAGAMTGEIPVIAVPRLADALVPAAAGSLRPQPPPEAASIEAEPHVRDAPPLLPRAAILGAATLRLAPSSAPRVEAAARNPSPSTPALAANERQPRRFALLAICVAFSAGLGALGGSLAMGGVGRWLAPAPPPPPAHADASEEIRALKDSIVQLRANLKTIGDNVAAVRAGLNASFSSSTAQFAKLAEAIDKLEHHQAERHAAAASPPAPPPETTGSIAPAPASKPANPAVVEGWVLRKAYRGAALVEGRYGIIEIEPGDHLPGVGRVEEIKRQDGHWVVVTARGLILPVQ